ncbi:MAG: hypothetical protein K2H90_06115 [Oscillospiraceae bacterium]|nr:hypothetical protein [Oscillospiraceae bacterium]
MKKKLSFVLAFLMAASIMAGCKKTEENTDGLPDITEPTVSLTQMTTEETTTTSEETTTEETTTEETTESETETTTASETTSATTTATAATASAAAAKDWNETEISETLYIKTSCYSRTRAIVGSDSVKKYSAGTRIEVVAATDTGYYKLADGTFIHSDYVTDEEPAAATTTKKVTTTKATEDDGLIIEDDTSAETTQKQPTGSSSVDGKHPKNFKDRYPYQQLSKKEQQLYQTIVEAAYDFKDMVDMPQGLDSDQIYRVYSMVYDNEPQLFWLSRTIPTALGGMLLIDYSHTKSEAEQYQAAIDKNRKEVMKSVNGYSSTISKLKVIYDWIVLNNVCDTTAGGDGSTIVNGIGGYGVIQCQGYAKSFLYLCDYAGIECMTVPGINGVSEERPSHAWNIVYCDNGYYIVDTTWGDPIVSYGNKNYIRYTFFLSNDSMIENTHLNKATMTRNNGTVVKIFDPPACTKTSCYYFKAYNKEYSDFNTAKQAILDEIDSAVKQKKNVVEIKVTDHDLWEQLFTTDIALEFQKYAKGKSSSVSKIMRQRAFTEGSLVVQYDIVYN